MNSKLLDLELSMIAAPPLAIGVVVEFKYAVLKACEPGANIFASAAFLAAT